MAYFNTVFQQLLQILPRHEFESIVRKHQSNRYIKKFTCWNQLMTLLYSQATGKDSLRDIVTGLRVQFNKWYHLGIKSIARSTISHANKHRTYQIYEELFYKLYARCRHMTPKHRFKFKNPLYALDATTIGLCLSLFPWARFRKRKGAIKMHCLLDYRGEIPSFIVIKDGKTHDVIIPKTHRLPVSSDSIIVVDKAYIDFEWLFSLSQRKVFFVTQAKHNFNYTIIGQHLPPKQKQVLSDEIVSLNGFYSSQKYPEWLRLVTYYDPEKDKIFQFITNNFELAALTIARIYKARWDIETFFKWIKQHLKIKTFLGTSENAVLSQIWVAMCYYLMLAYIKFQAKYKYSLLHLTRVIRETFFDRVSLIDLFRISTHNLFKVKRNQLQLTLF